MFSTVRNPTTAAQPIPPALGQSNSVPSHEPVSKSYDQSIRCFGPAMPRPPSLHDLSLTANAINSPGTSSGLPTTLTGKPAATLSTAGFPSILGGTKSSIGTANHSAEDIWKVTGQPAFSLSTTPSTNMKSSFSLFHRSASTLLLQAEHEDEHDIERLIKDTLILARTPSPGPIPETPRPKINALAPAFYPSHSTSSQLPQPISTTSNGGTFQVQNQQFESSHTRNSDFQDEAYFSAHPSPVESVSVGIQPVPMISGASGGGVTWRCPIPFPMPGATIIPPTFIASTWIPQPRLTPMTVQAPVNEPNRPMVSMKDPVSCQPAESIINASDTVKPIELLKPLISDVPYTPEITTTSFLTASR